MMRKLAVVATLLGLVAGCGGGSTPHATTVPGVKTTPKTLAPVQASAACSPGKSYMGCSAAGTNLPHLATPQLPLAVVGPKFPDVSDWQGPITPTGHAAGPDWAAAKSSIAGAAVKAYEFSIDPDFIWNVTHLKALHIPWVAYDFVRSCNASGFIAALRQVGGPVGPPIFDMEVSAAHGCAASLENQVFAAFHVKGIIYSSPGLAGTSVGSSDGLDVWVAAYGPSSPPCLFTCNVGVAGQQSIRAWQFTDGQFGSRVFIPGIGFGDVSVNYGLISVAPKPPPAPKPVPKPKPKPKPVPKPKPKPSHTYNQGFQRGYRVGFNTAWKAAH